MGWLKGAAFEKLIMPLDAKLGPLEDASKMVRGQAADEALVRKSCRNIVVLAVFFLDNPDNQARQRILTRVGRMWLPWHSLQNKQLRRAGHSGLWLQEEIGGRFLSFCSRTRLQLSENLEQSGVLTTFTFFEARVEGPPELDGAEVSRENELCQLLGTLVVELVAARIRRCLWFLRGWPGRLAMLSAGRPEVEGGLQQLQEHRQPPELQAIQERSCFRTPNMKQILRLMEMLGGLTSEEALAFLERRGRRLLGTQLIEDGFKRQRRAEQKQINGLGRAVRTFGILTSRRILGKVHQLTWRRAGS